ncbi:MAG: DUF4893 domain-containing protein [Caulobacteraceae bacterium]
MKRRLALILALAAGPALAASADWTRDARPDDVQRLDNLRSAWTTALRQARRDGHGAELAGLGALADPKAGLDRPEPPPGAYRCRTIKLGDSRAHLLSYVAYPWFRCRIELAPGGDLILDKTTGSQRTRGHLYPQNRRRLVYIGAQAWGDDRPYVYGQDRERDQIGVFERIGPQRWRLVLPWPKQESDLDLLEFVPG